MIFKMPMETTSSSINSLPDEQTVTIMIDSTGFEGTRYGDSVVSNDTTIRRFAQG
jgi:hypothetical protein